MMQSKEIGVDHRQVDFTECLLFLNDWNARATGVGGLILSFPLYAIWSQTIHVYAIHSIGFIQLKQARIIPAIHLLLSHSQLCHLECTARPVHTTNHVAQDELLFV